MRSALGLAYVAARQAMLRPNGCPTVTVRRRRRRRRPGPWLGLRGLAARVEALDGRLDVESPPKQGNRITAEIP
jgi:signal transduction histidine kinase